MSVRVSLRRRELAFAGMTIGLFGGTFNPAHEGHAHVAETALKRLGLDRVWWLVTPQNPLKDTRAARPLEARMMSAARMTRGPRMTVTDIETRLATRYTADSLRALKRRFPGVRFVWIMGADNLPAFHRWNEWAAIFAAAPIAVIARPGFSARARLAKAPARFAQARKPQTQGRALARAKPPAWTFLCAPLTPASSTALRAQGLEA